MSKKIIFSAGGTGGHIFPAINMMKHFFDKGYEVLLVTDSRGKSFTKNYPQFKPYVLRTATPTNKNLIKKLLSFLVIFYSIMQSFVILKKEKPKLIFGFGGYVSFPIAFASKFFNLPLVIYENNLTLGRTNKYLLPISKKIFIAKEVTKNFPEKYKNKICKVGSILDKNIIDYPNLQKDIILNIGRFGPYLKCDNKSAQIESVEDIFSIGLNRAITLISDAKPGRISSSMIKDLGEHPEDKKPVRVMKGKFGPYVKYKSLNATIPDEKDPHEITMDEALILIEKRKEYDRNKRKKR